MSKLLVVVGLGLGASAQGDWSGMRDFLEGLQGSMGESDPAGQAGQGFHLQAVEYNDAKALQAVVRRMSLYEQVVLIGHSHGADAFWDLAQGHYGFVTNLITCLVMLDAKPRGWRWWNWGYQYPIPPHTLSGLALWSGFGRPFVGTSPFDFPSVQLDLRHDQFLGSPRVHHFIRDILCRVTTDHAQPV